MIRLAAVASFIITLPGVGGAQSTPPAAGSSTRTMHIKTSTALVRPIPIERPQGAIVIAGQIASQPATFLFDNGSDATLIDTGFARSHGMTVTQTAQSLNTGLSTLPTGLTQASVAIGDAFRADGQFVTADLGSVSRALGRPIAGVLGADMLAAFVVVVNPAKSWIAFGLHGHLNVTSQTVGNGSSGVPAAGVRPAMIPFGPGYAVSATINGRPVSLRIDYGSAKSAVLLRDDVWQRLIPPEARTERSATSTRADGLTSRNQQIGMAKQLKLSADLSISDVPVIRRDPSDHISSEGLLGLAVLGSGTTILDTSKRQLWLYPANQDVRVTAENNVSVPASPSP